MAQRYSTVDDIRQQHIMKMIQNIDPFKVVDYGCGTTRIQHMKFKLYVGIDNDKATVNMRNFVGPDKVFMREDYETVLPRWPPNMLFDLALWNDGPSCTTEHSAVFLNIKRSLVKRGLLIVSCPNGSVPDTPAYKSVFTLESLVELVEDNGFTVLEDGEVWCRVKKGLILNHWLYALACLGEYDPRYVKG